MFPVLFLFNYEYLKYIILLKFDIDILQTIYHYLLIKISDLSSRNVHYYLRVIILTLGIINYNKLS